MSVGATKRGLVEFLGPNRIRVAAEEMWHRILCSVRIGRWVVALMRVKE